MTTSPGIHRDDTMSSTTEEGRKVASVAAEEAQNVAGEATDQVRRLVEETREQARGQATAQRDRLVDTLRTFGEDLENMAAQGGSSGLAAEVARQAADRARSISTSLDGREPADLLEDLRGLARRRPGLFLLGALAAGVVAGRLARGAASSSGAHTSSQPSLGDITAERPIAPAPATYSSADPLDVDAPLPASFDEPAAYPSVPR